MSQIREFRGPYYFLSNFYPATVEFEGIIYATSEHAFQAAKTVYPDQREKIREAKNPGLSKKLGREVTLRSNWDTIKYDIMLNILRNKFDADEHSEIAQQLLDTGDIELLEGNNWGDKTWGVCNGEGSNWLGKILMQVRIELRSGIVAESEALREAAERLFAPLRGKIT